jgi:hypothetical protein
VASSNKSICHGPLTFDQLPPIAVDEDVALATADDQAKLIQWHYRLGSLSFQKLKQLALNGEIAKKLTKLKPPQAQVHWLSIWHKDQATLARQRVGIFSQSLCCYQAKGDGLS